MSANEDLQNRAISHAIYMERYKTQVVNDVLGALEDSEQNLIRRIRDRIGDETFTRQRLERLLDDVRDITGEANKVLRERLRDHIQEFGGREAEWTARTIGEVVPIELNVVQPSPRQIYSAVISRPLEDRMLSEAVRDLGPRQRKQISAALRRGFIEGQTTQQIVRTIKGSRAARYTDGIMGGRRRHITSLVRTAINHTHSVAREELAKENEDIIKGVQWVATLDTRTTLICASRDGKSYPVDEGPRPPAHINCRSTVTPILKSWRELGIDLKEAPPGTRASMDGQVPDKVSYSKWLGRQSKGRQIEVLGRRRWEKWREGEDVSRFVQDDRVMSLDELERKEGA